MIQFYDSVNPDHIPSFAEYAALYHDGIYAPANRAAAHRFKHKRWITIHFDYANCSIIDFEKGNPCYQEPSGLRIFAVGRKKMGFKSRIYCDRADLARAFHGLGSMTADESLLWWIPTADDKNWSAEELARDIHQNWGVTIRPERIWANQNVWNRAAGWDRSNLFLGF